MGADRSLPPTHGQAPAWKDSVAYGRNVPGVSEGWCRKSDLAVSVDDLGFRQGVTVVERLRTYAGRAFEADRYLRRFQQSLDRLGLPMPMSIARLNALIETCLHRNHALVNEETDVGITLCATPGLVGQQASAETSTLVMHLNRIDHSLTRARHSRGQALVTTGVTQQPDTTWPRSVKVRSRLHYYLADQEARRRSPDGDVAGLLIDADGSITESSIANVLMVVGETIVSPLPSQILPGVTQSVVAQIAERERIAWQHARIQPKRLLKADAVLLTGTDHGVWWANQVDGESKGMPTHGSLADRLITLFRQHVSV